MQLTAAWCVTIYVSNLTDALESAPRIEPQRRVFNIGKEPVVKEICGPKGVVKSQP